MAQSDRGMKYCSGCDQTLPLGSFGIDKSRHDGRRWRCRACSSSERRRRYSEMSDEAKETKRNYLREWRAANPEREKARARRQYWANRDELQAKRRFLRTGVTQDQYDNAFAVQGGKCAICGVRQDSLKRALAADHCHATGVFRGLLCDNCNHGLGKFKDSPDLLLRAVEYLQMDERWRKAIEGR